MELQTAFYIVGIVFMALSLVMLIALLVSVLIIRAKVHAIQTNLQHKLEVAGDVMSRVSPALVVLRRIMWVRSFLKRRG